jgi:hypothetical protein
MQNKIGQLWVFFDISRLESYRCRHSAFQGKKTSASNGCKFMDTLKLSLIYIRSGYLLVNPKEGTKDTTAF